jgi:hypothetical protein
MAIALKLFSLLLMWFGIAMLVLDGSQGAELPLLAGLFIAFVTREKIEDERTLQFKSSSAYAALVLGYGIKLLVTNLYDHRLISFRLIDINHFLILVFALALILYRTRLYLSSR